MKLKILFFALILLFLQSCGSGKSVRHHSKNPGVVLNETKPKKLPSVNQKEFTKKLLKKNPK